MLLAARQAPNLIDNRTASYPNPWAIGSATLLNAALLALVILIGLHTHPRPIPDPAPGQTTPLNDFTLFAPAAPRTAHGGGGGGSHELIDPVAGRNPKRELIPLIPPQVPLIQNPKLALDPAIAVPIDIKLPDNPTLPNIGVHSSPNVRLASNGPGGATGIGTGSNRGDGPGNGTGEGPGSQGGYGDSVYTPGVGGVSKPIPIVSPEAEFSDEARRQHYEGICIVAIIVDAQGNPRNPKVTRSLGLGLDEKALEAVQKYRFKPAMKDGKPVASYVTVEIDFHLY
jgi:TonB family protein